MQKVELVNSYGLWPLADFRCPLELRPLPRKPSSPSSADIQFQFRLQAREGNIFGVQKASW